ncbi:centromere-associated protein E [Pelobates fuscus]|uniref:centromere-associated protein E n=1 Tax=Pelobates fuscus TaxID=191477 RepID=UPI002FE4B65C
MSEGDAVQVCVRVRPLIQREHGDQLNLLWRAEKSKISQIDGTKSFNFDRVFHSNETTSQVYQEMAIPIIRSVLHGYHGTIFAYGQTSSGKTYTMMGTTDSVGIIPQAVQDIFKIIQEIPNREFLLRVSYMEIYNETVTDLLCDDRKKKPLEIREDIDRNVYVADLTEEIVMIPDHVIKWIKKGEKNRRYGETKMNEHSSRSHTIFRMILESRERSDPGNPETCDGAVMVSHLNLVDLAGSERASQTGAEGVRLKEGCNINRSLFILGQVIKKLSDGQAGGFINYRDSKLTRILQNSLGGNTKTLIICTVTPVSFDETLSTLQFASTAKHVRNTPHVNEVVDDQALLKRYRKEIMDLKKQLEQLEASSGVRTQAMAKEEHTQLLEEIQQLQNERQNRIWNLANIIIAPSEVCEQERAKRKRRVTWAPGKLKNSLGSSGFTDFDIFPKLSTNLNKKPKFSDLTLLAEVDDSICTEFSDVDELAPETDWNIMSRVTSRDKSAAHCHSMMDFYSEEQFPGSHQFKDSSQQKCKEMEQKIADLESQLKKVSREYEAETKERQSFAHEITNLKEQLETKEEEKNNIVKLLEHQITTLEGQLQTIIPENESIKKPSIGVEEESPEENDTHGNKRTVLELSSHSLGNLCEVQGYDDKDLSHNHSLCQEQIQMLEQKIIDLEQTIENLTVQNQQEDNGKSHTQDLMETIQLCEALMTEKGNAQHEVTVMRNNFDSIILENETLKREVADLERQLKEKTETSEFEELEKETQKEHEAQLMHEIVSLKKVVENAEVYNQDLETELETKSNLLKEQEKEIIELKKNVDNLQKKMRNMDLCASMGDTDNLCEEVFQLKQSLSDAEAVTRDAQKESAFLKSENRELKEKMDKMSSHCQQRENDASSYEKQLESEKSKFKQMQADLQKELQCAFNEINQLTGLMAGKVPKDLLTRVELEKEISNYSKQLAKIMEEKTILEKEVACLSEYKYLPSEIEHLKHQLSQTSEELDLLKSEREQHSSIICKHEHALQEQTLQITTLTDEITCVQSKLSEAEKQYSELKRVHAELEEKYMSATQELVQKQNEAECLLKEIEQHQCTIDGLEQKLSTVAEEFAQAERDKEQLISQQEVLIQAEQNAKNWQQAAPSTEEKDSQVTIPLHSLDEVTALLKERDDVQKTIEMERDDLKEQLSQTPEELDLLKSEREQHSSIICKHEHALQEQTLQITTLTDEITCVQSKLSEAEKQYSELKRVHAELEEKYMSATQELVQKQNEAECLLKEIELHQCTIDGLEQKLSTVAEEFAQAERDKEQLISQQEVLIQAEQNAKNWQQAAPSTEEKDSQVTISLHSLDEVTALLKERDDVQKTIEMERDDLKEQLSLQGETLHDQANVFQKEVETYKKLQQDLSAEIEQLKGCLKENQQSLDVMQAEKSEVYQKLRDVQKQLEAVDQERSKLLSSIDDIKAERDDLRSDLNENIELSIETQDELRTTQQELKQQKKLVGDLKKQLEETATTSKFCQDPSLGQELEEKLHDTNANYKALIEEKYALETTLQSLMGELELLRECTKAAELAQEKAEGETRELEQKLCTFEKQLFSISCERDEAKNMENNLTEERNLLKHEIEKNIKQIQCLNEEIHLMKPNGDDDDLRQQKLLAQEKMDLNEILENVGAESHRLKHDLQKNIEMSIETQEELQGALEELKHKTRLLDNLKSLHDIPEDHPENHETALEHKVLRLEGQMNALIQERDSLLLELKATANRKMELDELVSTLTEERNSLQEKSTDGQISVLAEKLQDIEAKYQELLCEKHLLETAHQSLKCELELLREHERTVGLALEKAEEEKVEAADKLCTLEKHSSHIDEADNLKVELNVSGAAMECSEMLNETQEESKHQIHLGDGLSEQILKDVSSMQPGSHFLLSPEEKVLSLNEELEQNQAGHHLEEHVQAQDRLQCEVESLLMNLENAQSTLESRQREKHEHEQMLCSLQQQMEAVTQERDEMRITQASLISERDQLNEALHTNTEMVEYYKNELQQKALEGQHMLLEKEELQETQKKLKDEVELLMKSIKDAEVTLQTVEQDKLEADLKLLNLQKEMEILAKERDELRTTQEKLTSERDQVTEDLKINLNMIEHIETSVQQTPTEEHETMHDDSTLELVQQGTSNDLKQLMSNLKDTEARLQNLQQDKVETEQKFLNLQKYMEPLVQERDELKLKQDTLIAERERLQEDLKNNTDMFANIKNELHQKSLDAQQIMHEKEELELAHQRLKDDLELINTKDIEAALQNVQQEKLEIVQQLLKLQQEKETLAQEREALMISQDNLTSEWDQEKVKLELVHEKLKDEIEQLMKNMKGLEETLQSVQQDKWETEQKLLNLQQQTETLTQEREELKISQENRTSEWDQEKVKLELVHEKLKDEIEKLMKNMKGLEETLQSVQQDKWETEQKSLNLQQQIETLTQEREELRISQENRTSEWDQEKVKLELVHEKLKDEIEQLMKNMKGLEETLQSVQQDKWETEQKLLNLQQQTETLTQEREELKISQENRTSEWDQEKVKLGHVHEKLKDEIEQLMKNMKGLEETLQSVQQDKWETEQKSLNLQQQMETLTQEREELRISQENVTSERDLLKGNLEEHIEMVMNLQNEKQKKHTDQPTMHQISFEQVQQRCKEEMEALIKDMKQTETKLQSVQQDKLETEQKCTDLQQQMETLAQERDELKLKQDNLISERDQLKEDLKENIEMSIETQDDLRKAQEELQLQKHRVQQLTSQMSLLEEKLASVEKELIQKENVLSETLKEIHENTKQEVDSKVKALSHALESSELALEQVRLENDEAARKVRDLTVELGAMSDERTHLQKLKENLKEEVNQLNNELENLKQKHALLEAQHADENLRQEELVTEIKALKDKLEATNSRAQLLEAEKDNLQKQIQEQDLKISSLYLEQEQFQQLLQRVRNEKENIYSELQGQEKESAQLREELNKCQTELQVVKQQKEDINEHLNLKVNTLDELTKQISSLQEQIEQLQQAIKDEREKNFELNDEIERKDKDILLLNLKLSLPPEEDEEDELAKHMDTLKEKTQEITDLLVKISGVYSDQHSLINSFASEIHNEEEICKSILGQIKDKLSPTQSRSFRSLQTEHVKINSQLQTVISKFKLICMNAIVKEEQYSLLNVCEVDLITEQKKHEELELQIQCLEQHGTKWTDSAADDLKFYELEFLNKLINKKYDLIKHVEGDFSAIQVILTSIEQVLQDEAKCKQSFNLWLDEFKDENINVMKLNEGVQQENKRIIGMIQLMTKKLRTVLQSKIQSVVTEYLKNIQTELEETKVKNTELMKRVHQLSPTGSTDIIDNENARLQEKLKSLQAELKKMQSRIKNLEDELDTVKADAKVKEERAVALQNKLLLNTTETELAKIQIQLTEKDNRLQTALKEIENLQSTVSKGAKPYQEEIDQLKTQVVKIEMERMKLSKSMDKEIASLKSCLEDKEECLRKLKEQLRRAQKDSDTSVCSEKDHPSYSHYPLTCGGGSGIVQSTAFLVLQSENAKLEREASHYKKKYNQLSRNIHKREDKKMKVSETPAPLNASHESSGMLPSNKAVPSHVSPTKSEIPNLYLASPGKTGMQRKREAPPYKAEAIKRVPLSPSKAGRHSVPSASPSKPAMLTRSEISPEQTQLPLLSSLISSPCKKQTLLKNEDSPKQTFFDVRSKSLPYCPTQFFDNSKLGTLPDVKNVESTAETETWWYDRKKETANECKTS